MHYLEETRPQRPLMPSDVYKRAKVCPRAMKCIPSDLQLMCDIMINCVWWTGAWSLWGDSVWNTAFAELGCFDLCGRGEKEGMGTALDK